MNNKGKRPIGKILMILAVVFFYLPILYMIIFSFNDGKSLTSFTGFSLRWYKHMLESADMMDALSTTFSIALLATFISTVAGTIAAIGVSKSKKLIRDLMEQANILLLGVGNALELAEKRRLDEAVRKQLEKDNAVAEACGYYFDGAGKVVYETRSIGIDFNDIDKMDCIILVAGGKKKAESLLAVSHSIPNGIFVTDEGAALEMLRLAGK